MAYGTTVQEIMDRMKAELTDFIPPIEMQQKAQLIFEIEELKQAKNAVLLGHNYMEPALYHTVTDFNGDSLELARRGAATDKPIIVFCGVEFMAETAKILSPEKKVLLPSAHAGCSLASSITGEQVRELKKRFPGVPVVSYVNTYAEVKAETDICCTSGNAAKVVESLPNDDILFLPDEYLARNVAKETGRNIIFPTANPAQMNVKDELKRTLISWHGKCEVHDKFTVQDIQDVRKQFPDVVILAHPECRPDVVEASDFSGSTSRMISYVKEVDAPRYLLLTECAMGDNIIAETKNKDILRLCSHRCPHMGQITLEQTRDALLYDQYEITVPEEIAKKAKRSLDRMLEIS